MKRIHILLVEDNKGDILLIEEALEEGKVANDVSIVKDGEKAIQFLDKEGDYKESLTPDLIILDINLPRKNGFEVLQYVKQTDHLKHIPVIMLTTSSSERDIAKSYDQHANCYITKPVGVEEFLKAVTSIEQFWIELVKLPKS
jgi:CheY-like chemotaxis protein